MPAGIPGDAEPAEPSQEAEAAIEEDSGAVEPVSRPQEKPYQLLADAREAYWLREYDTAESKYLALTRLEPDNPDGYGELGNMYFSQGKWDQAATAYYAAGVRLVEQGLLEQAEELIAVIRGLNGANADDLEQKIADARSAANQ
jgi:predicted Zn-dependent protease